MDGQNQATGEKPLSSLSAEYQAWRKSLLKSGKTLARNRYALRYFLNWLATVHQVTTPLQLKKEHIYAWQEHVAGMKTRQGRPLKPASINNHLENAKMFLLHLAELGFIHKDFAGIMQYVKIPWHLPGNVLPHAQMRKLLSGTQTADVLGYRNRAMLELLYSTGIRAGELLALDVAHVDFPNATAIVTGKGNKQRAVPIGRTALKYLESYLVAVRPYLARGKQQGSALFLTTRGTRVGYRSFLNYVHSSARRAGVKTNVTPHTFRRSCTTELIRGDANIYHVKELLGHATLDTLRDYTRLTINDLKTTHSKCHPRERDERA